MSNGTDGAERDRRAFAAMRSYRRVMTPHLSEESVRHLWDTQERERAAWRAVVDVVVDQTEEA